MYDLTSPAAPPPPGGRRRHGTVVRKAKSSPSHQQRREACESATHNSYMSGELDQSFNYVYRGGLRSAATPPTHHQALPPISLHYLYGVPSTVHLDPALPYQPQNQTEYAIRANWARIVASHLNSDLLVKQIMIENRLRTMQMDRDLGRLNLEGIGIDPKSIYELDKGAWLQRSSSNSLLLADSPTHRKTRKKRPQPHQQLSLDWCMLNAQSRGVGGLGGPNVMGEKALLQTFDEPTKYRLSRLTPDDVKPPHFAIPPPVAKPPYHSANRRLQELLERDRVREASAGRPIHVSVVSPSLGMGAHGTTSAPELYWQQDSKVKHISKLRSL